MTRNNKSYLFAIILLSVVGVIVFYFSIRQIKICRFKNKLVLAQKQVISNILSKEYDELVYYTDKLVEIGYFKKYYYSPKVGTVFSKELHDKLRTALSGEIYGGSFSSSYIEIYINPRKNGLLESVIEQENAEEKRGQVHFP